jgi:di/tricarboxylate transporter
MPLHPGAAPEPGDRLLLVSRSSQWEVAERAVLDPTSAMDGEADAVTARVVVAHGSFLIGQGYEAVRTRSGGRIAVIAGGPRPARLRQPLDTIRIEAGDQLFIRGPARSLARFVAQARLLEVDRFDPAPLDRRRAAMTVAIFGAAIAVAVTGAAPPALSFLGAAGALAALRLLPSEEIYRSIDWPIILLLGAMIPVGDAFETSGAADIVARWLGEVLAESSLFATLAALCAGTLLLSIFLNNVATALLMGPIAIQLSRILGIDPDAALLAVLIGASSDFLTPIGHQNNLLVMGPGGYRFTDYARVGAVLSLLTVLTAALVLSSRAA